MIKVQFIIIHSLNIRMKLFFRILCSADILHLPNDYIKHKLGPSIYKTTLWFL